MNRLQKIKNLVRSNNFEEAKRELLSEPLPILDGRQARESYKRSEEISKDPYNNINDRGFGRVSNGLRFLELVTLLFTGKTINSVLQFDRVPRYVDPIIFLRDNSEHEKIKIIVKSLGMYEPIETLKVIDKEYYDSIKYIFLNVYKEVESGFFRFDNNREVLAISRSIIRRVTGKL